MRKLVHTGLSRIVTYYGTIKFDAKQAEKIIWESIQPDELNRQEIEKNVQNKPVILLGWWVDHSLCPHVMAEDFIEDTKKDYKNKKSSWVQHLGYSFHFIVDRSTPYHDPNRVEEIGNSFMKRYEEGVNYHSGFKPGWRVVLGIVKGLTDTYVESMDLKEEHDKFEDVCESRWAEHCELVLKQFLDKKEEIKVTIESLRDSLQKVHEAYKAKNLAWLKNCSKEDFSAFMANIAYVMDLACQYVFQDRT